MADNIITSNMLMKLPIPGVTRALGLEPVGESWLELLNLALQALDAHDHSTGRGAPLSSGGISVDRDFDVRAFNAIRVRSVRFEANATAVDVNLSTDRQCVFFAAGEFYVRDLAGNAVRITNAGAVDVSVSGGWTGMAAPASASYGSGRFDLRSDTGIWGDLYAANIGIGQHGLNDAGAAAGGYRVRLQAGALASDYGLTFPAALPNPVSAEAALDTDNGTTLKTRPLCVKQDGTMVFGQIGESQLATSAVTNTKLGSGAVTHGKIGTEEVYYANIQKWSAGLASTTGIQRDNLADGVINNAKANFGTPVDPGNVVIKSYFDGNYAGSTVAAAAAGWVQIGTSGIWYAKRNGVVFLRGSGTSTGASGYTATLAAGSLPSGFCPLNSKTVYAGYSVADGVYGNILAVINADGSIVFTGPDMGLVNTHNWSVDGVSFPAEA